MGLYLGWDGTCGWFVRGVIRLEGRWIGGGRGIGVKGRGKIG